MNSDFARFEMDADERAEYEVWVQARHELLGDFD